MTPRGLLNPVAKTDTPSPAAALAIPLAAMDTAIAQTAVSCFILSILPKTKFDSSCAGLLLGALVFIRHSPDSGRLAVQDRPCRCVR